MILSESSIMRVTRQAVSADDDIGSVIWLDVFDQDRKLGR